MKLKSTVVVILIVVMFFGVIALTKVTGSWSVEGGSGNGNGNTPNRLNIESTDGSYAPGDIRGSFTYEDVSNLFGIPMEDLIKAYQLPEGANAALYRVNFLESVFEDTDYEMGTSAMELFVSLYTGLPYETDEEPDFLASAVAVLQAQGNLTPEQEAYLAEHTISMEEFYQLRGDEIVVIDEDSNGNGNPLSGEGEEEEEEHEATPYEIEGETTFGELLEWGMTEEFIESVLGDDLPSDNTVIREYCQREGLQYDVIKGELQDELDLLMP